MPQPDDPQVDRFYVHVGDRIRDARSAARLTQAELAASLGLARSSIANIEGGRQRLPLHMFVMITKTLNVNVAELLPDITQNQPAPELSNIGERLQDADESSRDFVESTLAQLIGKPEPKE
ncbi:helix-turn-helix transcriptional regulator [Streptomyces sp. MBT67]|uniref:helix-turn-helix domain-containing protein n=1 Tax=unclassified Streptomyces TaxID=2593676 RepID=UPI00190DC8C0|nr:MULTISPECIES: helix-turn-helix transcriptional regulator [unclassified Streptomyces]MBK3528651.1 helix-turn-helix transcriptional regulator [Streptomyces sp. MBT72]MBK3535014.1 helix-turn-helix transcriptional regulator [Streptomyces sp. MBT67]MBK3548894.1 helix-turn-helix transcriptional regulator [Streptomyces sp. MBT61]MBK6026998.1 helix-turn-helix transcriptional regulator [Streptomyces sp. MBT59]